MYLTKVSVEEVKDAGPLEDALRREAARKAAVPLVGRVAGSTRRGETTSR